MSGGDKFPLSVAGPVALELRELLTPGCERIEFAGSLRRAGAGDPLIGDVELVAIAHPVQLRFGVAADRQTSALDGVLTGLIERGLIRRWPVEMARGAWGDRYKKFWVAVGTRWLQVDLFLADRDNFGSILTIRTGSEAFSKAFVTHLLYKTPYRQQDGYLRMQADGQIVPVAEEEDYFERAGVQWIPAAQRRTAADMTPIRRDDVRELVTPAAKKEQQLRMF